MATTDAKSGFRLPWIADRDDAATVAPPVEPSTDTEVETPAMIDAPAAQAGSSTDTPAEPAAPDDTSVPGQIETARSATPARTPTPAPTRKPNKLMADLTRAMQAAAEQAREEALERLTADAKTFIETIHATSANEATELRRLADDDVAGIRDRSKQEIARIREETETRISGRKHSLEQEIEEHAAAIERRIERVQSRVASFEAEMAAFFERLTAEQDPTRLAAMAETLPEPPSFDAEMDGVDGPAAVIVQALVTEATEPGIEVAADADTDPATEALPWPAEPNRAWGAAPDPEAAPGDPLSTESDARPVASDDPRLASLGLDLAAAEAEAAAFSEAGDATADDLPPISDDALAARLAGLMAETDASAATVTTRVVVVGLTSVASIAGFKRHLARVPGVDSVGVSSGPDGEFVFAVSRGQDLDLATAITTLTGFAARITGESDGDLHVTARDPEAEG